VAFKDRREEKLDQMRRRGKRNLMRWWRGAKGSQWEEKLGQMVEGSKRKEKLDQTVQSRGGKGRRS
jgi:hypothetical protein